MAGLAALERAMPAKSSSRSRRSQGREAGTSGTGGPVGGGANPPSRGQEAEANPALPDAMPPRFVGQRLRRKEDLRLVSGRGRYVGDIHLPGMLHAAILRSPVAHARITSIDVSAARGVRGVAAVVTAADLSGKVGPFVEGARLEISPQLMEKVGPVVKPLPMPVLADGSVFWAGQPVAAVLAESRYIAEDALETIKVDYEPLPVVVNPEEAVSPGAPVIHASLGDNVAASFVVESGDAEAALSGAAHVFTGRFKVGRQASNAMETRGVVASFDRGRGDLSVWCTNARPHLVRTYISQMMGMLADQIRVISPDMGGSFGTGMFSEDILVPFLATSSGRPVKWVEDRSENLANTRHGRDLVHYVEVGYGDDGRIVALKDKFLVDCGAYNPYAITVSYNCAAHLRNQFDIPAVRIEAKSVLTNKAPVTPVRGAGRPEQAVA